MLLGKHGSLVDTIILAYLDNKTKEITLISIPRDLYYKGRKINSVYSFFGINEFKRQLSNITGLQIDKYILIDMYAFIDVINYIGGVDVTLDKPLIDPSYKTFDNGKWGTLYYEAGTYHLNGKQALRLARSRHYSSDFARAERQQKILKSLKMKAKKLGFGDVNTIMNIINVILKKTETDISLEEALEYYFRYQNFKIDSGNVLSSGNVLESTYTGLMNGNIPVCGEDKEGCKINKGAYILLPKDDNWDIIKWFIMEIIEKKQ